MWKIDPSAGRLYGFPYAPTSPVLIQYTQVIALKSNRNTFQPPVEEIHLQQNLYVAASWGNLKTGEHQNNHPCSSFSESLFIHLAIFSTHVHEHLLYTRYFGKCFLIKVVFLYIVVYCYWRNGRSKMTL